MHTDICKQCTLKRYKVGKFRALSAGDATAHHGWLVHAAPPNESKKDRRALTISYVAAHAPRLGVRATLLHRALIEP